MRANFNAVSKVAGGNAAKTTRHARDLRAVLPGARLRTRCPYCGSSDVWIWETRKLPLIDRVMTWLGFDLLTCRNCRDAFYADERRRGLLGFALRIHIRSPRAVRFLRALTNKHKAA